jgi:osmoprotectant transport system ATP-binding protein
VAHIAFDHVVKRYPGAAHPAVDDVSFEVHEGAICMLLGTSGSGKTTLLRMVNRLIDPTSGAILIDGVPTVRQDATTLRRSIGYVIQQIGLFPHLSVADNVRIVPSILGQSAAKTRHRVDELLALVGLEPAQYRNRFPRQLSGGQQQRVGLARALAADPAVLLMDEPFGALDAINRKRMQEELLRIQRGVGKTILFVTHDVDEALRLGDQIVVVSDGKLMQEGMPGELLARPANMFVRQLLGADNIVRQMEFLPTLFATELVADHGEVRDTRLGLASDALPRIGKDAPLQTALTQLVETGANALAVQDDDGRELGTVTLASIYARLREAHATAPMDAPMMKAVSDRDEYV